MWDLPNSTATDLVPGFSYLTKFSWFDGRLNHASMTGHDTWVEGTSITNVSQVMPIHCKTNRIRPPLVLNQLFKISKLSKILTLCHQENTSKQKYKMGKNYRRLWTCQRGILIEKYIKNYFIFCKIGSF